uniref:pilus assembly protein PilP n=1 Tax=Thaumasiovibrio occultus TaxID=1891184 RepID=UPI000B34ECBE|nr:pilus assembly protein PilP [Thaumasiovibrio occultus]
MQRLHSKTFFVSTLVVITLAGCKANSGPSPVDQFTLMRSRATARVEPLPTEYLAKHVPFEPVVGRAPFSVPMPQRSTTLANNDDCWQPDLDRKTQKLEQFEIDSLAVKGIMGGRNGRWALVQTPNGQVERVTVGQYMGLNYGRVEAVTQSGIEVKESLQDGLGCWQARSLKLAVNQPISVSQ